MRKPYKGECIILTTKHAKGAAIFPVFEEILSAGVLEYTADTDSLGTFTGEVEREGNALECAKKKCEWGLEVTKADYGLASEGSFGPHPFLPFCPSDQEILYFIDRKRDFHLPVVHLTGKTNYLTKEISSLEELESFAETAQFPSHALIVRPNVWNNKSIIFKGIENASDLKQAFDESIKHSEDKKVWVETDMRAHYNPTRMEAIKEAAKKLANKLATNCPSCDCPGWGQVDIEKGLPCEWCGSETEMIKSAIYGCPKCDYKEAKPREDGLEKAEPGQCHVCNP